MLDLQGETLRLFLALRLYRPVWSGALLLGVGLHGRALALASRAAGAAGLFLEADAMLLRQAQREGCSTFTVTALGEAIRILKNEVRQGRAIAVALRQDPSDAMAELLHRGVQPQALAFSRPATEPEAARAAMLQQRGAVALAGLGLAGGPEAIDLPAVLQPALDRGWSVHTDTAATAQQRRQRDAELLAAAGSTHAFGDSLAALSAEWLRVAPSLLPRALDRWYLQPRTLTMIRCTESPEERVCS